MRSGPADPWAATRSAQAYFARARQIGTAVGAAYRTGDPDRLWVAKQLLAGRLAEYDRAIAIPATHSSDDDAWVAAQIAKRERYVRTKLAPMLGLDPDVAVEASRTGELTRLFKELLGTSVFSL